MENFFKQTAKLCSVDSLIDKFNRELNSNTEETRRLTVDAPKRSNTHTSIDDINNKIFDLENLIKRLQEEIDEMYVNADKKTDATKTYVTENIHKEGTSSQAYPLILSEVDRPLADQSDRFKADRDLLVNIESSKSMDSVSSITRAFAALWNDEEAIIKRAGGADDDINFNK